MSQPTSIRNGTHGHLSCGCVCDRYGFTFFHAFVTSLFLGPVFYNAWTISGWLHAISFTRHSGNFLNNVLGNFCIIHCDSKAK